MARNYPGSTVRVTILAVEAANSSRNGNPASRLIVEGGQSYRTETDGAVGYDALNVRPPFETTLHLTTSGRVWKMEPTP